ncbi:aromatic ring-hydroxylating oxygenase subunit alpha [Neotabrizicola shimadae]|uniref:Aromatic ring-hydroxylating dioxygenase subunit alpha n=1 Tax=Neotabrizicola shimadae TaxID=2807096 RepID=A0A8G0ZZT3_9RHOB|nr:aromatic ring-hydroxylating dioxygenase subunit alpha [Neotabrizicola shimadae]QYZ71439.1 aromatic ring-hydroxylating dioxygenase subunit alpha [Neotabrizicola shimadae]
MTEHRHPQSPIMDHCPATLPAHAYFDADWYRRELRTIWARNWVWAGRLNDLKPGTMQRRQVGEASVILCRTAEGDVSAFHNVCRHRGAELCAKAEQPMGKLVTCKYHSWAYAARDGRLVAVGHANPTQDFDRSKHGLAPVSVKVWNGFMFLNLDPQAGDLEPDTGLSALDNWPMDSLVTGHRSVNEVRGNWKILWENYNECLHCASIHLELSDLVPIYKKGIMSQNEEPDWTPEDDLRPTLRPGAATWTLSGAPCGPEFPGLTRSQREAGFLFVTLYPTVFIVAHVDYVRAIAFEPLGPELTRVTAEWYFPQETLDQPRFDAAEVAAFAKIVLAQDAEVVELNQRGLHSPAYSAGRLMPEEYAIRDFDRWVLREMETSP